MSTLIWEWFLTSLRAAPPLLEDSSRYAIVGTVVAAVVAIRFLWSVFRSSKADTPWKTIPGRLPLVGHGHLIKNIPTLVKTFEEWADEYGQETGGFAIYLGSAHTIMVCDPELAREVLKYRPIVARRTPQVGEAVDSLGFTGVFTAEGQAWQKEHRLVAAALNKRNVDDYLAVFRLMARRLIEKWKKDGSNSNNGTITVEDDLANIMADTIAKVAMDQEYDFLNQPDSQMASDVQAVMKGFVSRVFSVIRYWRIPIVGRYIDGVQVIADRIIAVVSKTVLEQEKKTFDGQQRFTFVDKLYQAMKSERSHLTPPRVVGNVLILFMAGTDTTTRALTCALYLIGRDPVLREELRREADAVDFDSANLSDLYTKLPRLKSLLHEVHRWYGNPLLGLTMTKEVSVGGSTIPKNGKVMILARYLSISAKLKTPPADVPMGPSNAPHYTFCPRRWLVEGEDGELACPTSPSFKSTSFMAFGYGDRSCPGRTYSEGLSYMILMLFLQTFDFELADGVPKDVEFIHDVLMVPDCQVRLAVTERHAA